MTECFSWGPHFPMPDSDYWKERTRRPDGTCFTSAWGYNAAADLAEHERRFGPIPRLDVEGG